jgi:light-regulated signal transduction histidine kinase (bacteriophytochrome)
MLRQVWINLIGNALKFSSREAQPKIEIGAETEGDSTVYFVRDNGAGFDMAYLEQLFGVFHRLHSSDEYPGTGAGLAIVKRVVERHGGRVWAEGKPGAGAVFRFALGHAA